MMASSPPQGVTEPISLIGPTPADLEATAQLETLLCEAGLYETPEEAAVRETVLRDLQGIVDRWVKRLTRQKGYSDGMVDQATALVLPFGSHRLGVHGRGSDIDALVVGPYYVNRDHDFFTVLGGVLDETEAVTELHPVDVTATGGDDDLREWKGWVESRLRLLAARAEADTSGMLLCHLHPHAYAAEPHDQRRTSSFFVGLSKPQPQPAAAAQRQRQQFDLRATTDGFKQEVYMYDFWRPGMELTVAHVHRKHLPSYVRQQLHSAGHQLKRKRANDDSVSSSSPAASDDSKSSSSSSDAKRAAAPDRIRSSFDSETQSCRPPSNALHSSSISASRQGGV
ncbi:hypothetical protein ABZP36_004133 [Zizania latifolia]